MGAHTPVPRGAWSRLRRSDIAKRRRKTKMQCFRSDRGQRWSMTPLYPLMLVSALCVCVCVRERESVCVCVCVCVCGVCGECGVKRQRAHRCQCQPCVCVCVCVHVRVCGRFVYACMRNSIGMREKRKRRERRRSWTDSVL